MNNFSKDEIKFNKIFETEQLKKEFDDILESLFKRTNIRLKSINNKHQEIRNENAKKAVEINRGYFQWVQEKEEKYSKIAFENNEASHKMGLSTGRKNSKITKNIENVKKNHKNILKDAKKLQKERNNEAKEKYNKFVSEIKNEIKLAEKAYLKNADFITKERNDTLEKLSNEYQKDIDKFNYQREERKKVYDLQMQQMRNSREKYVSINNEDYRRIKKDHTSVSAYYNEKIRNASSIYRKNISKLNQDYQNIITPLKDEIDIVKEDLVKKSAKIEASVSEYRDEIDKIEKVLYADYDEELHALKDNYDFNNDFHYEKLVKLEVNHNRKNKDLNKKLKDENISSSEKESLKNTKNKLEDTFKQSKKQLEDKLSSLEKKFEKDKNHLYSNYGNLIGDYERKYLKFEHNHYLKLELLRQNTYHRINKINNLISKYETEKNEKISKLGDAYEKDINFLDRILAIASASQELYIKDHDGEKSYIIADFNYQNETVKADYEIAIKAIDTKTTIRKIKYELDRNFVTVKYQLRVQEQMAIRDSLISQYNLEALMHKEKYNRKLYEAEHDFNLTKLNSDYETQIQIKNDELEANHLDYKYNIKKLETKNVIAKSEATKEFEIAQAKANRNIEMSKLSLGFYEAFATDFLDFIYEMTLRLQTLIGLINEAYYTKDFSIERFYKLLEASSSYVVSLKKELEEIILKAQDKALVYFDKKIEELTGYRYLNRRQNVLDQFAKEVILEERDKILETISALELDLANLKKEAHQTEIKISGLYKEIQVLKKTATERWEIEKLDASILELETTKKELKLNLKEQKRTEHQIKTKTRSLNPVSRKLERLSKRKENDLHNLQKQVRKEAKIFYQEHDRTKKIFEKFYKTIDTNFNLVEIKIYELNQNLSKKPDALDIFFKDIQKIKQSYFDSQFESYNDLLDVIIVMEKHSTNEQERLILSFEESYNTLNEYLENSYKASYNFEKDRVESDRQRTEMEKKKITNEFEKNLTTLRNTFSNNQEQTKDNLIEYDNQFKKAYTDREEVLNTINDNMKGVKVSLEQTFKDAEKKTNKNYQDYLDNKRNSLVEQSYTHARLYRDSSLRAIKYNEDFEDIKDEITRKLHEWSKDQAFEIKKRAREYKKAIREIKRSQAKETVLNKKEIVKIRKQLNDEYKEKIDLIKQY